MTPLPLRALIVEDSEDDTGLLLRKLRSGNYDPTYARVETAEAMSAVLSAQAWEIVFSDFTLPHFDALSALALLQNSGQDIPFIIVSGTIGEDRAVAAMKAGAHDYILKDNPKRLLPAVDRELREARMRAERRQAEEDLRESEACFRAVFEQAAVGIAHDSPDGRWLRVNQKLCDITGYTQEEFLHKSIRDLTHPADLGADLGLARRLLAGEIGTYSVEKRYLRNDGSPVWARLTRSLVCRPSGEPDYFISVVEDISAGKAAEDALAENENRHRAILQTAMDGFWVVDNEGRLLEVNDAYCQMSGYSEQELLAMGISDMTASETPDETIARIQEFVARGEDRFESWHRRKDGTVFEVEVSVKYQRGESGQLVIFLRDITERKRTEAQLLQSQKMESMGHLAGGIAHDFNNLLTVINGAAFLVAEQLKADDPLQNDVKEIMRAGDRAVAMARQLLTFSRKQVVRPKVFVLCALVQDLKGMLRRLIDEDIALVVTTSAGSCTIKADPGQIEQVIMNLVVNARDAMPAGGILTIEVQAVEVGRTSKAGDPSLEPGAYVQLVVSDTGTGMDEATRTRVFEPFFTTKEVGKGTGLGLSTVYGIVQQSGGAIAVDSKPGKGTSFGIWFPRAEEAVDKDKSAPAAAPVRGDETVLVVEDYPGLRTTASRMLERAGYTALLAGSGAEALELLENHAGRVHILLTDVVMPGMNGRELAERVAAAHPEIKVIFTSGYADDAILRRGVEGNAAHFLAKPYSAGELTAAVRTALGAG